MQELCNKRADKMQVAQEKNKMTKNTKKATKTLEMKSI